MRIPLVLTILLSTSLAAASLRPDQLIAAARSQIGITLTYDDSYKSIKYPNGDFSLLTGCCTDVLIRAYRNFGYDLQKIVHEDIKKNLDRYSKHLTKGKIDTNIDHRRVSVLHEFFSTNAISLPISQSPSDYSPSDIIVWRLPNGRLHIGICSDDMFNDRTLIIHNIGYGVRTDDVLFRWRIIGHYRYLPSNA